MKGLTLMPFKKWETSQFFPGAENRLTIERLLSQGLNPSASTFFLGL